MATAVGVMVGVVTIGGELTEMKSSFSYKLINLSKISSHFKLFIFIDTKDAKVVNLWKCLKLLTIFVASL